MIPNPNEVSAFAVYSGLCGTSKSKQRRIRLKKQLENIKKSKHDKSINSRKIGKQTKKVPVPTPKVKQLVNNVKSKSKIIKITDHKKSILNECDSDDSDIPELIDSSSINKDLPRNHSAEDSPVTKPVKMLNNKKIKGNKVNNEVESPKPSNVKKRKNVCLVEENSNDEVDLDESINVTEDLSKTNCSSNEETKVGTKKKKTERTKPRVDPAERKRLLKEELKKQLKGKSSSSSIQKGKTVFESLILPFKAEEFFSEYWEKKPLFIDRGGDSAVFSQYLSTSEMDTMLRYNMLMFGRNVDITSYTNGIRETHNPEGRAHPHIVWDYYSNGCSVRILNPQTYLNKIHTLLAALQEYFGCFVGSNIYLTPADTQGFAPHYDDIEAFILQIEGSKHWKVYKPKGLDEQLPRYSSRNFTQDEIGTPILDVVLRPGDLLYFPRGYIHQAEALPDQHSLHITISTYQKTTWLDLIEQALPVALARASEDNLDYRKGLPIGYLRGAGLAHPSTSLRGEMTAKLRKLIFYLEKHLDVDDAVDKLGLTFIHQSLPPVLSQDESECSVHNGGLKMVKGQLDNRVDVTLQTKIRWIRANAFRITEDSENVGQLRLYHSVDNSKEYEGEELQFLILDKEFLPALLHLVKAYPAYTSVSQLPCSSNDEKLVLVGDLWDRGLLVSDSPLQSVVGLKSKE